MNKDKPQIAVFAGGCFWCTEAIFQRLKGVLSVTPGYTGGKMENPSYEVVSTSTTGHAEAIKIIFDPAIIIYETLLEVFFKTHDPTTVDRQGSDVGEQYRSEIFYINDEQKREAEAAIKKFQPEFENKIVTKLTKFEKFYEAEKYHKNYYNNNKSAGYCRIVIDPKIQKLYKNFGNLTRDKKYHPTLTQKLQNSKN
jgi:peptide-methionine (S)-S-oxide reductase